jgi:Na+-translocating ferredoxin:NAD+ oxidoreductase RnfG subunit
MKRFLLAAGVLLLVSAWVDARDNHPVLSLQDVQRLMFSSSAVFQLVPAPQVTAASKWISADPAVTLAAARFQVWRITDNSVASAQPAGWLVTDSVIGKFEKIDYAVALSPAGAVLRVEVMKYRESHGHEVMAREWLAQFDGAVAASVLKVGKDIDGITGATLSCVHMTEGVRRVTRLIAALQQPGGDNTVR